jgi:hypothetical protein
MLMLHLWCLVSVHVLVLSLVDCGFDINQIHTIKSSIGCFFSNHTALRSKTKDWLSWDQDNVSLERHVYPMTGVLVSQHYKNQTRYIGLYKTNIIVVCSPVNAASLIPNHGGLLLMASGWWLGVSKMSP